MNRIKSKSRTYTGLFPELDRLFVRNNSSDIIVLAWLQIQYLVYSNKYSKRVLDYV